MDEYDPEDPSLLIRSKINFHLAAKEIELIQGHFLRAYISWDGDWRQVTLDLDQYIGNSEGRLVWGGKDFSWSSTKVELSRDIYGWCPGLYATSMDSRGRALRSVLNLAQCIGIENGALVCSPDMRFVVEPVVNERQAILYFQVRS
ncbi:CVNH domain-containing protein [Fusarium falciforme]|nr:CVNH domain-containing protein [Fusarium falciforme]WAO84947.1 CVNH domain-containing protein [Fusarium falciforme]